MEDIKISQGDREPVPMEQKKSGLGFKGVILIVVLSLVFGIIGGAGGMMLLVTKGANWLEPLLGDGEGNIPTTVTEKIRLEESSKITDVVDKVVPSVVSILAANEIPGFSNATQKSAGTGFIITSDGLIMTNKHVVSNASAKYTVFTNDGKSYPATVQSLDPFNDLAVIKIEAKDLPVVDIGDPDDMKIGQSVVAIGNALGEFSNTVTVGVLSAKDRVVTATDSIGRVTERLEGLLQTDAAINSGNSGGPLVNLAGQVIGVNVAVAANAENIGFSIPTTLVTSAIESIKRTGKIVRPFIGVRYISLDPQIAKNNNLSSDYGALLYTTSGQAAIIVGGPAAQAGLKENDIIIAVNGQKIDATHSLALLIQQYQPNDEVELTYLRNGQENKVRLKLGGTDSAQLDSQK